MIESKFTSFRYGLFCFIAILIINLIFINNVNADCGYGCTAVGWSDAACAVGSCKLII
jgi:hypothetical protein